jgi:hypothetical protein
MSDEITELFEAASLKADREHRDDLWPLFVVTASAAGGPGVDEEFVADSDADADSGDSIEPTVTVRRSPRTEVVQLDSSPSTDVVRQLRPNRRPLYTALAVAAAAIVAVGGIAMFQRDGTTTVAGPSSTDVTTTTTIDIATTVTAAASSTTSVTPTTAKPAVTSTAPKPTTTVTTQPVATTSEPSVEPGVTIIDAAALGAPKPVKVLDYDAIDVGDFDYRLSFTADSKLYYAGFTSFEQTAYKVATFDTAAGKVTRYDLPSSFLRRLPNTSLVYRDWFLGPNAVLYGFQYNETKVEPIAVLAVPTTGAKNSTVAAKVDLAGDKACAEVGDGVSCGGNLVMKWVLPDGSTDGAKRGTPANQMIDRDVLTIDDNPGMNLTDAPVAIEVRARKFQFRNLRTFGKADADSPQSVGFEVGTHDTRTCIITSVGWEQSSRGIVSCYAGDNPPESSVYEPGETSVGGSLTAIGDFAVWALVRTGAGSELVRYPFK